MKRLFVAFILLFSSLFANDFAEDIDLPEGCELADFSIFDDDGVAEVVSECDSEEELVEKGEQEIKEPLYLEALPSAMVAGLVNAVTGDLCITETDLVVPGPRPLAVQRTYCSADGKWRFSHQPKLEIQTPFLRKFKEASYRDDNGSGMVFRGTRKLKGGDPDKDPDVCLKVRSKTFEKNFTNCGLGEISGQTHWKNSGFYAVKSSGKRSILLRHGTHVDRLFQEYKAERFSKPGRFLLSKELHPEGTQFLYKYAFDSPKLSSIYELGQDGNILSKLSISRKDKEITWASLSGSVLYQLKKKNGVIETVFPSLGVPTAYDYGEKNRLERKYQPDGRLLSVKYHKGKVERLKSPIGPDGKLVSTHTFKYKKHLTTVFDAKGQATEYHHQKGRLEKIKGPASTETFTWSEKGDLLSRSFLGKEASFRKELLYDANGNIVKETLFGKLTGKEFEKIYVGNWKFAKKESSIKTFGFTKENLPEWEKEGKLYKTFTYYPKTNLIKSRFTKSEKTVRREFFEYDKNGVATLEIVDDGTSEKRDDLANVTERHIKAITPTKFFPYGLVEKVEEFYLDLKKNQRIPLKTVCYTYNPQGQKLKEKHYDQNGRYAFTLSWKYDKKGRLIQEKDPLGNTISYTYDANGNKTSEQHPHLLKTYYYDKGNRLVKEDEIWPDGTTLTTKNTYNTLNQKIAATDPYGNQTLYDYDSLGHLEKVIHPPVSSGVIPQESYINDAFGNKLLAIDPLGNTTKTSYTIRSQPYLIQYPDNSIEKKEYNLQGHLVKEIARNGVVTNYTLDSLGRAIKTEIKDPNGKTLKKTLKSYSTFHLLSETDEEGVLTTYQYDFAGRKIEERTREKVRTFEYDTLGRNCKTIEWADEKNARVTTVKYDPLNRIIEEIQEELNGEVIKHNIYAYDASGNKTETTTLINQKEAAAKTHYTPHNKPLLEIDPLGNKTHYHYDFSAPYNSILVQKVTRIDPLGNQEIILLNSYGDVLQTSKLDAIGTLLKQETCQYDPCRRLISKMTLNGVVTTWEYDSMGNEIACTEAGEKRTESIYNTLGQKIATHLPNGIALSYVYDILGRQTALTSSDKSIHYLTTFDKKDRPLEVKNCITGNSTTRIYDPLGRLIQEILETGLTLKYAYDSLDRLTFLTLPDETAIRYLYSGCRLLAIERIKNNQVHYVHRYLLQDAGRVTLEELINQATLETTYDDLLRVTTKNANQRQETLSYDPVGNLVKRSLKDPLGSQELSYTYDPLYQLIQETGGVSHSYSYDSTSNRIKKDGGINQVNALNQLLSTQEASYIYDKNGCLIEKSGPISKKYTYDALNRLISAENATYTYDAFHRRLSKTKRGKTERYLYQNQSEIGAVSETIHQLRILGKGLFADVGSTVAIELNGTPYAVLNDASGNLCQLIDQNGEANTVRYSAFGEKETDSFLSPWQFSGKRYDAETGFLYFGKRYYDPEIGRFITPDPAGFEDGLNLYTFVHNNPLNHIDPDGEFAFLIPIAVNICLGYAIDACLPYAVAAIEEYAGGTVAAVATSVLKGYQMDYASAAECSYAEKAGMAIGTLLAVNPRKMVSKGAVKIAETEAVKKVAEKVAQKATKPIAWSGRTAAKGAAQATVETSGKVAKTAFEKGVAKGVVNVSGGKAGKLGDKFSRSPKSIQDQMTLKAAKSGEGIEIIKNLSDSRYQGMSKIQYHTKSVNGKVSTVHYVKDPKTGELMDFKFTKHSID